MIRVLTIFFYVWVSLVVVLNIISIIGHFLGNPDVWTAIGKVQEMYSPFNLIGWITQIVVLSPAIGAYFWRERLKRKVVKQ